GQEGEWARALGIWAAPRHPPRAPWSPREGKEMGELTAAMNAAATGMQAQSARLRLSSENIANADTPGYRRKTVPFEETMGMFGDSRAVATGPVQLSRAELVRIH